MTDKFSHFFQKLSEPKIYIMDCWKSKAYYTCWLCGRKNLKVIRFHGKATWFKTIKYLSLWTSEKKKINFVDPSNIKSLWLIEVYRKKQLFFHWGKKNLSHKCCFSNAEEIVECFWAKLWVQVNSDSFFWLKKFKKGLWTQRFFVTIFLNFF